MSSVKETVGGRPRPVMLIGVGATALLLLWLLRSALFPFVMGTAIAYLMLPAVQWVESKLPYQERWPGSKRVTAILAVYAALLVVAVLLGYYVWAALVQSFTTLLHNAPQYTSSALLSIKDWGESYQRDVPPALKQQTDQMIQSVGTAMGSAVQQVFSRALAMIPATLGFVAGLAAIPVFLFYILKDWERLGAALRSALPQWLGWHASNIGLITGQVLGRYIRAQLICAAAVGGLALGGLLILRIPFTPVLAVMAGATELIPTLGPWIGGVTAVMVTLAFSPEKAIWVGGLFALVQLVENNLLVPRIQSASFNLHPALAIVLLVVGAYLAGFWGLVLAIPLTATAAQIYGYIRLARENPEIPAQS